MSDAFLDTEWKEPRPSFWWYLNPFFYFIKLYELYIHKKYMRSKAACDGCTGTFIQGDLTPTSGDWWLCDKCLKDYMNGAKDAE